MVARLEPISVLQSHPLKRRITVLGSTGSIGQNTLDLLRRSNSFQVSALSTNRNVKLLAQQAIEFKAEFAVVADETAFLELKNALSGSSIRVGAGQSALEEASCLNSDVVMAAIVGAAGIKPTFKALAHARIVAIANKECLVAAGNLFMKEAARTGATILPVDSEHSAILQVLDEAQVESVEKIILTASGGPFRCWTTEQMKHAQPKDALAHPNWSMGAKISIDSATMMNKGLEMIEAYHLFPVEPDQIDVIVHPQSIIHSLVTYADGAVLAQLGQPDMRTPISVALAWPNRMKAPVKPLNLVDIGTLSFESIDKIRFPALDLAMHALRAGGVAPIVLNAANEVAVEAFLNKQVAFLDIAKIVDTTLSAASTRLGDEELQSIDSVLEFDLAARHLALENIV
jgi:1-deoxy-D-xylulose-5-phosphate reductoisomerase